MCRCKAPVAGIAMGLISDTVDGKTEYVALTDILGAEDAFGDMDFKVAGTKEFVTALQLDTKLDGIPSEVLAAALTQARDARLHILDVMAEAIDGPDEMSPYAPRVTVVKIPVDKIGAVIGPKGADDQLDPGRDRRRRSPSRTTARSTSAPPTACPPQAAVDRINAIANPQMPKVGERFLGTVVKTAAFGAFVSLLPGKDGLVHISKLGSGKRIGKVEDVVNVGDKLQVEIAEIDQRGKISLVLGRRGERRGRRQRLKPAAQPGAPTLAAPGDATVASATDRGSRPGVKLTSPAGTIQPYTSCRNLPATIVRIGTGQFAGSLDAAAVDQQPAKLAVRSAAHRPGGEQLARRVLLGQVAQVRVLQQVILFRGELRSVRSGEQQSDRELIEIHAANPMAPVAADCPALCAVPARWGRQSAELSRSRSGLSSASADTCGSVYLSIHRSWISRIGTRLRKCSFSRPDLRVVMSPASSSTLRCFITPKRVISSLALQLGERPAVTLEEHVEQEAAGRVGQRLEDPVVLHPGTLRD